ncbi:MAG: PQQ-dependent sugar dehydrogenase [Tepidisphaeraceae bacterium]
MTHSRIAAVVLACSSFLLPALASAQRTGPNVPEFDVRPGFKVTLAASDIGETRFIEFGDNGVLYLSQPGNGSIRTLIDKDGDGVYETKTNFLTDKPTIHGMCWHDGWLYWGQTGFLGRSRDTNGDGVADETEVLAEFPQLGNKPRGHWWRSVLVTDDAIYTSVGDSGNITENDNEERQKIWKYTPDGKSRTLFATGIRNTEKLRMRPGTTEIYGCDHGSDWWGGPWGDKQGRQPITDNYPPEEFNLYVEGGFYGHPFVTGNKLPRIEFSKRDDIMELADRTIIPAWSSHAHWANNGFNFTSKDYFPGMKGDAVIAFHGSWNSKERVGYKVQRILFDSYTGKPYGSQTIVDCLGGPDKQRVLARPCDVAEALDGTLLFTDDQGGRIFRISKE